MLSRRFLKAYALLPQENTEREQNDFIIECREKNRVPLCSIL